MAGDDVTEPPADPAGEARDRFEDAFERLQARSKRSAELVREGADFDTLTADHAELEMMRREAWRAKKDVVSRYEGKTPDYVSVPVGMQDTTNFGRIAAIVGALLLAAALPVFWFAWSSNQADISGEFIDKSVVAVEIESGTRCVLELNLALTNNEDVDYRISRVRVIVDRAFSTQPGNFDTIIPARTTTSLVQPVSEPRLPDGSCPTESTRSIGTITIELRPIGGVEAPLASVTIRQ